MLEPSLEFLPRDILVVDPDERARAFVKQALTKGADGARFLEAGSLREARIWLEKSRRIELVLLELALVDGWGHELIALCLSRFPAARVVVHSAFDDDSNLLRALGLGAHGYLLKGTSADEFCHLLQEEGGRPAISPVLARRLLETFRARTPDPASPLTPKELEVVQLLSRGLTNAEAADCLGISSHTVSTHVKSIYRKLQVSTRAEMTSLAARRGWSGRLTI